MSTFLSSQNISTTCGSNYCFSVTLLRIKHVNADENKDENGSFGDCIILEVSALLLDNTLLTILQRGAHSPLNYKEKCEVRTS